MRLSWTVASTKPPEPQPLTWGAQTRPSRASRAELRKAARRAGGPDGAIYDGTRRFR